MIKHFLLSRKTILSLVVLILSTIVTGYVFPQRFSTSTAGLEQWRQIHHFWSPWVDRIGLDHVYSTPWFALLLFTFLFSLILSSIDQIKISIRKTFGKGISFSPAGQQRVFETSLPEDEVIWVMKREGYFRVADNHEYSRFIKHPYGYWGNVLLHLGMVIAIASSLVIVLTQQRGVIKLVEGEMFPAGSKWGIEDNGMLAGRLILPDAVRLDSITPEFWETDDLKQLTTEFSFIDSELQVKNFKVSINQMLYYKGIRVYQQYFGAAFFLEFTDKEGRTIQSLFLLDNPPRRDEVSYAHFTVKGIPYTIKTKYFADAEKKTMNSRNPLFVLRLIDRNNIIGEVSLRVGESGAIGNYTIRLVNVSMWVGLIFTVITGMPGIYLAFFIIILGGGINYFTPPREFVIRRIADCILVSWKGSRFDSLYKNEYERVRAAFTKDRV